MKIFPFSRHTMLTMCIGLMSFTTAFAQVKKANFGLMAGVDFTGIKVAGTASPDLSKTKISPGYFAAIRVTTPLSKRIALLRLQLDLSFRTRTFETTSGGASTINIIKVAEREVQLDPIFSKILHGVGKEWNPLVRGGFNVNYALKRSISVQSAPSYDLTDIGDLLTANLVLGFGMMHRKSGFFTEINTSYEIVSPKTTIDETNDIIVNWFPLAFNLGVGFLFGGGDN